MITAKQKKKKKGLSIHKRENISCLFFEVSKSIANCKIYLLHYDGLEQWFSTGFSDHEKKTMQNADNKIQLMI